MSLQMVLMVVFGFIGGPEPVANPDPGVPAQEEDYFYWDVFCDFNHNVFPAYHLATATIKPPAYDEWGENLAILGDPNGRFGVFVHGAPGSYVRMALRKNAIMEESLFSGYIPENAMDAFILPKVLFDYDALRKIKQPMPLNLVVTIQFDDDPSEQKAVTVALRSINDCLFGRLLGADAESIENGSADYDAIEFEPFTWLFAAYVNENHPGVQKILKQALEAEIVPNFAGYLGNADAGAVIQQVFAVWNVLQRNGVKYSNITSNESEDVTLFSQHVRFLDEVVDNTQANCVDGTVLFASVLRKIGIQPYLVLAPGHMYLAFSLDGTDESLVGLETTLMGSTTLKSVGYNQQLTHEMREQMKNEASWAAFEGAIDYGSKALSEALAAINKSNDPRYQIVSVALARKMGIMPIAFSHP